MVSWPRGTARPSSIVSLCRSSLTAALRFNPSLANHNLRAAFDGSFENATSMSEAVRIVSCAGMGRECR